MRTIFKFANVIIFVCLLLVSCSGQQTSPAVYTQTPPTIYGQPNVLPQDTPPILLQGFSALSPVADVPVLGTTQIQFLVDNSGSVIGKGENKGCNGSNQDTRVDFVGYIRNILTTSVFSQNMQYLSLRLATFGDKYSALDFYSPKIPLVEGHTNYRLGIQDAIRDMYKSEASSRYLIIITDGAFTSESVYAVQTELQNQVKDENQAGLSIYIALLCPEDKSLENDISSWYSQIDTIDRVEVFSGLEEVAKKVFDNLKSEGFLPVGSESIVLPDQGRTIEIPGYARSAIFSYWNADDKNILNIMSAENGSQASLSSGMDYTFEQVPTASGCLKIGYNVNNNKLSKGLVFVKPLLFQNLQISVDSLLDTKIEIVNYNPIEVELTIKDGYIESLGKWHDCFIADITSQDEILNIDVPNICGSLGNLCSEDIDKNLHSDLILNSSKVRDNSLMNFKIKLNTLDDSPGYVWESGIMNFSIKFQTEFNSARSERNTGSVEDILISYFLFNNVLPQSKPDVYMLSDLDKTEFDIVGMGRTWDLCPGASVLADNKLASKITSFSCPGAVNSNNITNICAPSITENKFEYELRTYWFSVERCGYKSVLFDWSDAENVKAATWKCDILGVGTTSCEKQISHPVIVPIPEQ